jgi:transposase
MGSSSLALTREVFDSIYAQGQDAVFSFVSDLHTRVIALEEQVAKNSGNSSKPPSSDGYGKKPLQPMTTSLRKATGKKAGGQPGRVGKTLEPVETPDQIVVHRPECCPDCQFCLAGVSPSHDALCRRQVFEMPEPRVVVTEHRSACVTCPACGKHCRGSFPQGIDQPVQYGPNLLGFATYLNGVHLLPFDRCAQVVRDVTGVPFSPGSLARALKTAHQALAPFETQVKAALMKAPVLHVDETGSRVNGKLQWFHVRCTGDLCLLFRHERRGGVATEDLADYKGTLVSDFWSSYVKLSCRHAFCGAHLLRELTFQHQVKSQEWAKQMTAVFEQAVAACHKAREVGADVAEGRDHLNHEYEYWVAEGLRCNPPPLTGRATKTVCLLERLRDYPNSCRRFLNELSIPFTNNEAERDLRMLKVKGKISGCFRTTEGADKHARLRSYAITCRKQKLPLLPCLTSIFRAQLIYPAITAE